MYILEKFIRIKRSSLGGRLYRLNQRLMNLIPSIQYIPLESSPNLLPKKIYIYWDSGIENAPEIVKFCAKSWSVMNPSWEVIFIDSQTSNQYVNDLPMPIDKLPHGQVCFSDILRYSILAKHGGVWADSTSLCLRPLDDWLLPIFNQSHFFTFGRLDLHPELIHMSWFLAATKKSVIAKEMNNLVAKYWPELSGKRLRPYFWQMDLFEYLFLAKNNFRYEFMSIPSYSGTTCHLLQYHLTGMRLVEDIEYKVQSSYVQKLTWKNEIKINEILEILRSINHKLAVN